MRTREEQAKSLRDSLCADYVSAPVHEAGYELAMCHIEEAEHRAEQRVRAEIGEGQITLPTYEAFCNSAKGLMIGEFKVQVPDVQCSECEGSGFEDAEEELECSTCDGTGSVALQIPVPWTTIKEIYRTITEEYGPKPAIDAAREVG